MKISLNHIRYYQRKYNWSEDPAPLGADDLAERIGAQLGGIEEISRPGEAYRGVLIVKVIVCDKHPNADKLNICLIDDDGKAEGVERNEQGLVQVVCGAPNVRAGLTVAWLPPGSTVPESVGKEPFMLGSRELRGVMSNGMLASPRELALGDSHDGILEIDEDITPGTSFAEYYGLTDDVVFDIENKMFTHRPDCFGMLGVAREIAGIQQQAFRSPDWYRSDAAVPAVEADELPLEVRNELPDLVPRFTAIVLRDVRIAASPVWLQTRLMRLGLRPINNIVDLTNYMMLLTGQPIHAYDYDKVRQRSGGDSAVLSVRHPQPGETIRLLNGKTVEPRAEAMMVTAGNDLACIGGAMGGADTEVSDETTTIIIEAATWDMYNMRRTAMEHGIFTDAVTRFTKGQSPLQNRAVIAKITEDIRHIAGGKVASKLIDVNHVPADVIDRDALYPEVSLGAEFINVRLGLTLAAEEIKLLLTNVEFVVRTDGDTLIVKAPFWRTDIESPEDIVEEVGRLHGYDRLPLELPRRSAMPTVYPANQILKQRLRDGLSQAGANEVLTYSFVHGKLLEAAGQDRAQAYELSNALSPDLQYYRLSLTPSLLDKVHANIKAGYEQFALFEIGKAHIIGMFDDQGLPYEFERLALVFAANDKTAGGYGGAPYYQARHYLEQLLQSVGLGGQATYEPLGDDNDQATVYYASGRAATVRIGDTIIGRVGEYNARIRKALKLPDYCAGLEIGLEELLRLADFGSRYQPLSRYPKVEQDLCLRTKAEVTYGQLHGLFLSELEKFKPENSRTVVTPVDIYQRPDDTDYKQTTFRLSISSYDKTLRDEEVSAILNQISQAAAAKLGAERL